MPARLRLNSAPLLCSKIFRRSHFGRFQTKRLRDCPSRAGVHSESLFRERSEVLLLESAAIAVTRLNLTMHNIQLMRRVEPSCSLRQDLKHFC